MLMQLTLESLNEIDQGRPAKAFLHELARAVQDCRDRPNDETTREVSLVFKIKPLPTVDNGVMIADHAEGEFHIKSKVPVRKTKPYSFKMTRNGQLHYSSESPDNVDQTTFDDLDPETGRVNRKRE